MAFLKILLFILAALFGIILLYFLFLTVCALSVKTDRVYNKNSRFYRALLYSITAVAVKICRIDITVSGMEQLPKNSRFLLVSNHRSNFDPILTWHALKKYDLAFISKPENFKIPWFGRIIRRCCFMAIDRTNARNAMASITRAAELLRNDEVSIAVYPEGTRNHGGELLPFHNSVFKIAKWSNVPVVAVTVTGTSEIARRFPRKSNVKIQIAGVLEKEYIADHKTNEIGAAVRAMMTYDLNPDKVESSENTPALSTK